MNQEQANEILSNIPEDMIFEYLKNKAIQEETQRRELHTNTTTKLLSTLIDAKTEIAKLNPKYVDRKMSFYSKTFNTYQNALDKVSEESLSVIQTKYFIQEARHFNLLWLRELEDCSQIFDSDKLESMIHMKEL